MLGPRHLAILFVRATISGINAALGTAFSWVHSCFYVCILDVQQTRGGRRLNAKSPPAHVAISLLNPLVVYFYFYNFSPVVFFDALAFFAPNLLPLGKS